MRSWTRKEETFTEIRVSRGVWIRNHHKSFQFYGSKVTPNQNTNMNPHVEKAAEHNMGLPNSAASRRGRARPAAPSASPGSSSWSPATSKREAEGGRWPWQNPSQLLIASSNSDGWDVVIESRDGTKRSNVPFRPNWSERYSRTKSPSVRFQSDMGASAFVQRRRCPVVLEVAR